MLLSSNRRSLSKRLGSEEGGAQPLSMLLCPRLSKGASCALMWLEERCSRKERENMERQALKLEVPPHLGI